MKTKKSRVILVAWLTLFFGSAGIARAQMWQAMQRGLDAMVSDGVVTVTTIAAPAWQDAPKEYYEFSPFGGTPTEAIMIYSHPKRDLQA